MNADAIKTLTTDALDKLAALLDEGHSDRLIALLKTMARFHKYSWHNVFLIAAQRPDATRVAGFHTWRSLGRVVRRGEKGIAILAPIVTRRRSDESDDDSKKVVGFRAVHVFDVAQTDGAPLPEVAQASGDPGSALEMMRTTIIDRGITVDYVHNLGGALGTSAGGRIQILIGLPPAEELMVLAHEWAHELLHRSGDRPASRNTRELEAESVAYIVGQAIGLDVAGSSRDYIQLYRGDRDGLANSLDRVQRAASVILSAIEIRSS